MVISWVMSQPSMKLVICSCDTSAIQDCIAHVENIYSLFLDSNLESLKRNRKAFVVLATKTDHEEAQDAGVVWKEVQDAITNVQMRRKPPVTKYEVPIFF